MLDFYGTINPINFIVQDVMSSVRGFDIVPMNNYRKFDGYFLDIDEIKKNNYRMRIRGDFLRDLCSIGMDRKSLVLKYSTKFYIGLVKPNADLWYTNLFDDQFCLNELQDVFKKHEYYLDINNSIDYNEMINTIKECERVYYELDFNQKT